MISRFLSLFNLGMRAYKIQDVKRDIRIGVTAKSFAELLDKGCQKLKVFLCDISFIIIGFTAVYYFVIDCLNGFSSTYLDMLKYYE